ncbi:hypothetical protein V8D89_008992 [Ganoderma adspersum]
MQADETALPRKRARTSAENHDAQSPEKDEEFWYDDGTIILVTDNIKFRVYRGPLVKHSPVFRDMLALPQPPASQSTSSAFEDLSLSPPCPTVHVTDSPADLRHFLRVFVPEEILEAKEASTPSFNAVSAWIRLGHKYQYLRRFYPSSLSNPHKCGPIKKDRPADVQRHAAIAIVNLARLTGAKDLLPLALLECCKLKADIVDGYTREDGTVEYLQPEDTGRCFAAKGVLVAQVIAACLIVLEYAAVDASCRDVEVCQGLLDTTALEFRTLYTDLVAIDELLVDQQMETFTVEAAALCSWCRPKVQRAIEKQRREFWDALPGRLNVDVDGWAVGEMKSD